MSVSEAIPGASRLRNQNEILIEKSDEAIKKQNQEIAIFRIFLIYFFLIPPLRIANKLALRLSRKGRVIRPKALKILPKNCRGVRLSGRGLG